MRPRPHPPPDNARAAQAATLSYALGNLGHRQKSWMLSTPSANTTLPSPTPSDDPPAHASIANTRPPASPALLNPHFSRIQNAHAIDAPDTSPQTMPVHSLRHVAPAAKRPAGDEQGRQVEKRRRLQGSRQEQPPLIRDARVHPLPNQAPFDPPRSLSRDALQHPFSLPTEPARPAVPTIQPTLQQSATSNSDWYTVDQCLHVFYAFRASYVASPMYPRDLKRMEVLRDATIKQDWSYLIMHQYYCLTSYSPYALPKGLLHQPNTHQARQVMRSVLDTNDCLAPVVLEFFANYPFRMHQIAITWPQMFDHQARLLLHFITCSPHFSQLNLICERRKCPPIVQELADLGVSSPTFQRLLFTAFFRRLWQAVPPQPHLQKHFEDLAVAIFVRNQSEALQHRTLVAQNSVLGGEILELNTETVLCRWASKLAQLAESFRLALQAQGCSLTNLPEARQSQLYAQPQHHPQPIQRQQQPPQQQQHMISQNNIPTTARPSDMRRHSGVPNIYLAPVAIQQTPEPSRLHQPSSQTLQHQQKQPSKTPLLPPHGWIQPQQRQPNPARFSLHQADLQSPVLQAQRLSSPLYHYMHAFAVSPTRLSDAGQAVERWSFALSQSEMQCIPNCVPGTIETQTVIGAEKTRTVRLRCVRWPSSDDPNIHDWATADTSWIPHSYFKFNATCLQQRKKVHHGKDLPIDITGLLRQGENVLETTVMAMSNDTSYLGYLIAIEVLSVATHDFIKQRCLDNAIPAADTKLIIKNKLCHDSDEDFSIIESDLTINMFDPFSASKICDIPVRSTACLHIDCFDLETFLQTRRRKGDASVTDQWRCPICNADARPSELIVDGFLVQVKEELERLGLTQTRAITVEQDGTWKPKKEVRDPNGVQDQETPEPTDMSAAGKPVVPTIIEVIDLSD